MARICIIADPIAGGGRGGRRAETLAGLLTADGHAVELHQTATADDVVRFAARATPATTDALITVGGDGTLNRALDALPDPTLPVAMLPAGTANVFALELGLPRRPRDLVRALADPHVLELAVGEIRGTASGAAARQRFLMFAGVGLDAAMIEELERTRSGRLGKAGWFRPVLRTVFRLPRHSVTLRLDDGSERPDLSEVLVSRIRDYGGVFRLPRAIDVREPVLHALCFRQRTRWQWLWTALRGWLFGLKDGVDCERLTGTGFDIVADPAAPAQIDGDFAGRTPVRVELRSERFRILVPAATPGARPLSWRA